MTLLQDFRRVTKREPCPVCGRPDWCLVSHEGGDDPVSAVCQRVESDYRWKDAGWFHPFREGEGQRHDEPRRRTITIPVPQARFSELAQEYQERLTDREADALAEKLSVEAESLQRLGLGWNGSEWTFPMRDSEGVICGIQRRCFSGQKLAVTGSRMGLFIPADLEVGDRLFVLEGASDTAALLDLDFAALGRPSCSTGVRHVARFVRDHRVPEVVVVSDAGRPGQEGARVLATALRAVCSTVRVIEPAGSARDARAWVANGATRDDVLAAAEAAPPRKLSITVLKRGQR